MNPEHGVKFLRQFQELLKGGDFTATYKFALLQAIADRCVERDPNPDGTLRIAVDDLAEKFIDYYWNQARPFRNGEVLLQNHHQQAAVVRLIAEHRAEASGTLRTAQRDGRRWRSLQRDVARVVADQPLWKLQVIGGQSIEFLYQRRSYQDRTIRLLPGVAETLRVFHPLVTSMVRTGWMQQIHRIKRNRALLGPESELEQFLFGIDRSALSRYREVFHDHQSGICFYCDGVVRGSGELDHFVPWSRYPTDLGHNFVYAHSSCNQAKRDHLAATVHLERWRDQNIGDGRSLADSFDDAGLMHDLERSHQIAWWAYEQAQAARSPLWIESTSFEQCGYRWQQILAPGRDPAFQRAADEFSDDDSEY